MKNTVSLFMFLLAANYMMAQNSDGLKSMTELSDGVFANKRGESNYIAGSPYENEANSMGFFYLKDKRMIKKETKLNSYHNNFEYVDNNKKYLVDASYIDSVIVDGTTYVYRTFNVGGKNILRTIKVIDRRRANAIYYYRGVELLPEIKSAGYIDPKPARFEWQDPVYLFETGDKIIVLNNFKEFTTVFPGKENEIKKFIKENRIHKDKPDELKKLLEYVNHF